MLPRIVEETLSIMVDGSFYLQRIAGAQLRAINTNQAPTDKSIAAMSVNFNHLAASLQRYLNPPVIGLETNEVREKRQSVSFAECSAVRPTRPYCWLM